MNRNIYVPKFYSFRTFSKFYRKVSRANSDTPGACLEASTTFAYYSSREQFSPHEWFPHGAHDQPAKVPTAKPPNPTTSATQAKRTLNSSSPPSLCPPNAQRPPLLAPPVGFLVVLASRRKIAPLRHPGQVTDSIPATLFLPFSCFSVPFLPSWISRVWKKSFVTPNLDVEYPNFSSLLHDPNL